MSRPILLVDVDHTLSDAAWRDPMIGGPGGWDAYYAEAEKDEPFADTVALVNSLSVAGWWNVVLTARPEKWRQATQAWLLDHMVMINDMVMRPNGCFLPSPKVKVQEARKKFPGLMNVALVMDDRDDVCAAFRAEGLTVHQVHAGRKKT